MQQVLHRILTILLLLSTISLLAGCFPGERPFGERRRDFEGAAEPGEAEFTYRTFSGEEAWTVMLQAGQTLVVSYGAAVEKGVLSFSITDPDGAVIWRETLAEDTRDTLRLTVEQTGDYRLAARGINTGGGFSVSWQVED